MANNNTQDSIETLIAGTADPAARAILLVLSNINHALSKNTEATQTIVDEFHKHQLKFDEHREEFHLHIVAEQKLISGVRWAWWTGTIMSGAVITLASFIITKQMNTIDNNAVELRTTAAHILLLEAKVLDLERRQNIGEQRLK